MIDRIELKAGAREAMRKTRPGVVWVTLVVVVFLLAMQVLGMSLNGSLEAYRRMYESYLSGVFSYVEPVGTTSPIGWLLTVALDVMSMVLSVGYILYTMRVSRLQNPGFGDVFDAFGVFFRAVWVSVLQSVMIWASAFIYAIPASLAVVYVSPYAMLFCLPLMAPVVVVAYTYRLAPYIMLDDPRMSGLQCMALSRFLTRGRRWEMFRLDLSFIGWLILSIIPFVGLWVKPYLAVTRAAYYDAVKPELENILREAAEQARQPRQPWRTDYHVPGGPKDEPDDGEADDEDSEL